MSMRNLAIVAALAGVAYVLYRRGTFGGGGAVTATDPNVPPPPPPSRANELRATDSLAVATTELKNDRNHRHDEGGRPSRIG